MLKMMVYKVSLRLLKVNIVLCGTCVSVYRPVSLTSSSEWPFDVAVLIIGNLMFGCRH